MTNIENLPDFDKLVDRLEHHLNNIKHDITDKKDMHKRITIDDTKNIKRDAEKSFISILNPLKNDSKNVLDVIEKIEKLDPNLLYSFFNYETWGSTLLGDYGLHKEQADVVKDDDKFLEFVIGRILGFSIDRNQNILDEQESESDCRLFEQDEEAYSDPYFRPPERYYNDLNTRICCILSYHFTQTIKKFRDASRTIQSVIKQIKKEETFNDEKFNIICKQIIDEFKIHTDKLLPISLKQNLQTMLRLFYDYKKDVEEHKWKNTCQFKDEKDFHNDLEEYLFRVRKGEHIKITREGKKAEGKVDFQINDCICVELKVGKNGYEGLTDIILVHSAQLKQYMSDRENKIGFLLCMDLSSQKEAHADKENYILGSVQLGGRGVHSSDDVSPLGIIVFWIFGGMHESPSKLKK